MWTALALVVGNMVGTGAYLIPSALGPYGPVGLLGWTFTAAGALCLALVFARLGRIMPAEGGPYAYTRATMGDGAAFVVAWGYWVSVWVGNAAIATAFVAYLTPFLPPLRTSPFLAAVFAVGSIWLLTAVNVWGLREAAILQLLTTILKVLPLVAVGTLGLLALDVHHFAPFNVSGGGTLQAVTATATLTLWGFLGLECATIPAEEVRNPARTIPLATVLGTAATAAVYLLSTAAVMGVMSSAELAASTAPYAEAAARMWGGWAGRLVGAGAAVAGFGVLNGWVIMQGRMPLAPARDGIFPAPFARLSRRGTPVFGLVLSSALATVLVASNYTKGLIGLFTFAVLLATVTVLASYLCAAAAHILLIVRSPARFGGRGARRALVVSALAFAYSVWAVIGAGWDAVLWGCVLLAMGAPIYLQGRERRTAMAAERSSEPADA